MKKLIELLKRIFSKDNDYMSPSWIRDNLKSDKEEFHGVCWAFPIVKDF